MAFSYKFHTLYKSSVISVTDLVLNILWNFVTDNNKTHTETRKQKDLHNKCVPIRKVTVRFWEVFFKCVAYVLPCVIKYPCRSGTIIKINFVTIIPND